MIRRWTRIGALILATTLFFSFTSCTSDINNHSLAPEEDDKIKLRFVSSWGGLDSNADTLQQILDKFMSENKDIEVINESVFGGDFLPKVKTDFASGNEPDVFGIWPGSDIRMLINKDRVADLTDILNEDPDWKNSFKKDMWGFTTFNNKIYGLPFEIIYEGLFINKKQFDFYKIKVPETFDELMNAVKEFKKKGLTPIAYNASAEGSFIYQNLVAKLGSKAEVENPYRDGRFNNCYSEAMKYMKQLYKADAFPDNAFTLSDNERNNLFINNNAAMIVQGSWFIGNLKNDKGVDLVPFPYINDNKTAKNTMLYGLGNGTFYMSKLASMDPKKREASIKLLKALTSKVSAYMFTNQTGMLCNVNCDDLNPNYSPLMRKGRSLLENADELVGPPDHFVERTVWENTIVPNFPYFLYGTKESQEIWDEAVRIYKINNFK